MRFDKMTTKFQQALSDAQSLAVGNDNQFIEPQHLLLALLNDADSGAGSLLARAGGNVNALKAALTDAVSRLPRVEGHGGEVQVGRDLTNVLNLTDKEAQQRGDQFIASEMFLLALTNDKGECGRLLKQHGVARAPLEQAIAAVRGGASVESAESEGQRESLKKYCMDLTERARQGKLDPVIGRDDEIRAVRHARFRVAEEINREDGKQKPKEKKNRSKTIKNSMSGFQQSSSPHEDSN